VAIIVEQLRSDLTTRAGPSMMAGRIRDESLLESAISVSRQPYYRTTIDKAAALMRSFVKNHAFADGNKRIGVLVTLLFLEENGYELTANNDALTRFTLSLAASEPAMPLATVRRWLRGNVRPISAERTSPF